eukprot:TRINITY_DN9981_c0_g2_i1.p2 TRINITY_DN9981_c0_g2~~TRINITY_DN9981_c0_g2_i1.p2  ORF type:complete len:363 (+),score=127.25 TRINITY_DN9981_c0_g2_i1:34-1122(+)
MGGGKKKSGKKKNKSGGSSAPQRDILGDGVKLAPEVANDNDAGLVFNGGNSLIIKCPTHKYESTVAFYRDILRLNVEYSSKDTCKLEWSEFMYVWISRTDKLTHPSVWLVVDTNCTVRAKALLEKCEMMRNEVDQLAEGVDGFWASPVNDMVHLIKGPGSVVIASGKPQKHTPSPPAEETEDQNPLDVQAASHAPTGQKGKLVECRFSGGNNFAIKCPYPKYESTVAFYREVLGLKVVHYCKNCCKIQWNDKMSLWIDCVETICTPVIWLEVSTASTEAARAYLKGRKRVSLRPEVETLPPGVDGFWISPPNDMVHLIRGPDGQDEIALPPGELASLPFRSAIETHTEDILEAMKQAQLEEE